jgi:hypothetical protein
MWMLLTDLQESLKIRSASLSSAVEMTGDTLVAVARTVNEQSRAASFALTKEFRPDPGVVEEVEGLLRNTAASLPRRLETVSLPEESVSLVRSIAANLVERADDLKQLRTSVSLQEA